MGILKNWNLISGLSKFNLIWNAALFFLEALFVMQGASWAIVFMALFAGLFLWAVSQAKREIALKLEYAKVKSRYDY